MDSFFVYAWFIILGLLAVGIPFTLITNKKYKKVKNGLLDKCDKALIKQVEDGNKCHASKMFDERSKITSPEYSYLPENIYYTEH